MDKKTVVLFAALFSLGDTHVNQVLALVVFQEWYEMYLA